MTWQKQTFRISCNHRKATRPTDVVLLCLHGAYCNRGDFACIFSADALRGCGVLAVDLPGHGDSCKLPSGDPQATFPAELQDMADVVWLLLEALELATSPIVLVGHSMGGAVGLLMCRRPWPHLRSFVSLEGCLVATDTPPNGLASRWSRQDPSATSALDLLEDIAAAAHLGRDPTGILHWRACAEACGSTVHLLAIRVAQSLVRWSTSGDLTQFLDKLPSFHYVGGLSSGKLSPALIAALAGRAHCRIHALGGVGHFLLLDAWEAVCQVIASTLPSADPSATLPLKPSHSEIGSAVEVSPSNGCGEKRRTCDESVCSTNSGAVAQRPRRA